MVRVKLKTKIKDKNMNPFVQLIVMGGVFGFLAFVKKFSDLYEENKSLKKKLGRDQ